MDEEGCGSRTQLPTSLHSAWVFYTSYSVGCSFLALIRQVLVLTLYVLYPIGTFMMLFLLCPVLSCITCSVKENLEREASLSKVCITYFGTSDLVQFITELQIFN